MRIRKKPKEDTCSKCGKVTHYYTGGGYSSLPAICKGCLDMELLEHKMQQAQSWHSVAELLAIDGWDLLLKRVPGIDE